MAPTKKFIDENTYITAKKPAFSTRAGLYYFEFGKQKFSTDRNGYVYLSSDDGRDKRIGDAFSKNEFVDVVHEFLYDAGINNISGTSSAFKRL